MLTQICGFFSHFSENYMILPWGKFTKTFALEKTDICPKSMY